MFSDHAEQDCLAKAERVKAWGRTTGLAVAARPIMLAALLLTALLLSSPAHANHIVMHGGPFGGVVVSLVSHPLDPDLLYLAVFGSGVYRSIDGGRAWSAASAGLQESTVLSLVIDPIDANRVYAGTDAGIFASRDRGARWSKIGGALSDRNIRSLAVPPTRPTVLYAATDRGIFVTWNGGETWAARHTGITASDLRVVRVHPRDSARLFTAGFGGVFTSRDEGRHWTATNEGLTDRRVRALALDPRNPDVMYAATSGSGVFVTSDSGARWQPMNEGLGNLTVLSLLVTPRGERFVGTIGGVYRHDPAHQTWTLVGEDVLSLTITFVVDDPHRAGRVYAGSGGLLFVSEDSGARWHELAATVAGATVPVNSSSRSSGSHSHPKGGDNP